VERRREGREGRPRVGGEEGEREGSEGVAGRREGRGGGED